MLAAIRVYQCPSVVEPRLFRYSVFFVLIRVIRVVVISAFQRLAFSLSAHLLKRKPLQIFRLWNHRDDRMIRRLRVGRHAAQDVARVER